MPDNPDSAFARRTFGVVMIIFILLGGVAINGHFNPWWVRLIPTWLAVGCLSVILEIMFDSGTAGYLRLAPRGDAVINYTLQILGGGLSLLRQLVKLVF